MIYRGTGNHSVIDLEKLCEHLTEQEYQLTLKNQKLRDELKEIKYHVENIPCSCSPEIEIDPEERQCSRCIALNEAHPYHAKSS